MRVLIRAIATILLLTQALVPARAESPAEPVARVREALASPYGQALIAELGKNLRAGADAACLSAKAIAADQLETRGLALMTKWGTRMAETTESLVDKKIYAKKFSGHAELAKLSNDINVRRYLAIAQPIQPSRMLNAMFEQLDMYVAIKRIKLNSISPSASGNEALMSKDPADVAEKMLEAFAMINRSAALKRYLALTDQEMAARAAAMRKDLVALQPMPTMFYQGIEIDLAELCIVGR